MDACFIHFSSDHFTCISGVSSVLKANTLVFSDVIFNLRGRRDVALVRTSGVAEYGDERRKQTPMTWAGFGPATPLLAWHKTVRPLRTYSPRFYLSP
jgi:hypothetical protein